jgi:hypothetical protein
VFDEPGVYPQSQEAARYSALKDLPEDLPFNLSQSSDLGFAIDAIAA